MFDIGMYISQSESLNFLQNKYKDRKEYVSSLSDNTEMQEKIKTLKSIQESLGERIKQETEEKEDMIKSAREKVTSLEKQIESVSDHEKLPGEDVRLFREEEYPFDVVVIDENVSYDSIILPLRQISKFVENYEIKRDSMSEALKTLVSKYEAASKDYQTQLTNAIKIPLLVYSGRIIQNYPLGLGIRAVVRTNQLVFEAASKNGNDVYNILSTGQLNGLSIAFLLSIKNVYGQTDGLDILLIDDPLQTIDDISAISLADLLTQQGIGQIVLSTHEDAKAALLRYKFKKAGLSVLEKNMQELYMATVAVEG